MTPLAGLETRSLESLLAEWRFAPLGTLRKGDPYADRLRARLKELREADPAAWTRASKKVGW